MDQRKFSRVTLELTATVRCRDSIIKGLVENLSLKGMRVSATESLPLHVPVEVTLYLPGASQRLDLPLQLSGRVLRQEHAHLVVEFLAMDLETFTHLRALVAYNHGNADQIMDELGNSLA